MSTDHVDVLIVGAGLSGIGAAYHLQARLPGQDLRDPRGARRDRRHVGPLPLPGHPLGLRHVHARLRPSGRGPRRRRSPTARRSSTTSATPRATAASTSTSASATASSAPTWSSDDARWTVDGAAHATRGETGHAHRRRSSSCCTGYYRYDEGYTPDFPGIERFAGDVIHPQHWPEDLDYAGKRVVVIGSGATAVTLVPAMAERRRARDDAPALADLHHVPARRGPDRQRRSAACCRPRPPTRSCAGRTSCRQGAFFQLSRRAPRLIKQRSSPATVSASSPTTSDSTRTSRRPTTRGTSASASCPTATSSRRCATARASVVTDRIETFTPRRASRLESGAAPGGRRRRHRHRPEPARRSAASTFAVDGDDGRPRRDRRLQGHDVQRRPEPRDRARLHERLVDAEVRPHLRVRLPPAQPHGRPRLHHASCRATLPARRGDAAVHRPQVRLRRSARSTAFPQPGHAARRGGCTRTTRATS